MMLDDYYIFLLYRLVIFYCSCLTAGRQGYQHVWHYIKLPLSIQLSALQCSQSAAAGPMPKDLQQSTINQKATWINAFPHFVLDQFFTIKSGMLF